MIKKNNTLVHQDKNKRKINFSKKLKVFLIGGLNEIGKNCAAIQFGDDIIVVDAGMQFPEEDMLGIDFVIPDTEFLEKNKQKIRAVIITHGHLDHIGGLQQVLPKIGNPLVFATKLTAGLIKKRLEEFEKDKVLKLKIIDPEKDVLDFGKLKIEFFRVNHSIPDGVGIFVSSPAGKIVHTGDFKFDFRPADNFPVNFSRLAEIGQKGIDVVFADSTSAGKSGFCPSEQKIAKTLETIIRRSPGRLIIATFSSSIGRLNQIINTAAKFDRKVFLSGRSMITNLEIAVRLGYAKFPKGILQRLSPKISQLPPEKVLILMTGSQGEPQSALTRIALGNHTQISIKKGDTVVFSSSPIPGNERGITTSINNLIRLGARVITNGAMDVHASGHAHAEDLKILHSILRPKYIVPIHGELFMRQKHAEIVRNELGFPEENIFLLENGEGVEILNGKTQKLKQKISANLIMVDGLGVGDIGAQVLRERKMMSENGVVVILFQASKQEKKLFSKPDIFSRGFIFMRESREIIEKAKKIAESSFCSIVQKNPKIELKELKRNISRDLQSFFFQKIRREPMILPIVFFG